MKMNPLMLTGIADLLGVLAGVAGGGNDTQQVSGLEPSDSWSRSMARLGAATPQEQTLGSLQYGLGVNAMGAANQDLMGAPSMANLTAGYISPASQSRIHELAYGGLDQGINQAMNAGQDRAMAQGVPLSSMQYGYQNDLVRPLLSQASQQESALSMQELNRMAGLRQSALSNSLAMQNAPALDRLLGIRLQEASHEGTQMTRFPGGLPDAAYGGAGMSPEDQGRQRELQAMNDRWSKLTTSFPTKASKREAQAMLARYEFLGVDTTQLRRQYQASWGNEPIR
jgi:hypothetical protein